MRRFPFLEFHSNAGVQLQNEIHLLPPSLCNPCGSPGVDITNVCDDANPNLPVVAEEIFSLGAKFSPGVQAGDHMEGVQNVVPVVDPLSTMNPGADPECDPLIAVTGPLADSDLGVDLASALTASGVLDCPAPSCVLDSPVLNLSGGLSVASGSAAPSPIPGASVHPCLVTSVLLAATAPARESRP
jgi:hypothetical protein